MAIWLEETFSAGPDAATVTAANTAFTTVNGSPTFTDTAIHGSFSCQMASATYSELQISRGGRTHFRARVYVRRPAGTLTNHHSIMLVRDGTLLDQVQLRTDNRIYVRHNFATTGPGTSTYQPANGDVFRLELEWSTSTGMTLRLWHGANLEGATPDETLTASTAGDGTTIQFGPDAGAGTGVAAVYDGIALSDGEEIGPFEAPSDHVYLKALGGTLYVVGGALNPGSE